MLPPALLLLASGGCSLAAAASAPPSLAELTTFGGTSSRLDGKVTADLFTTNETEVYAHDVSPGCAASPSCAALMTFLWTVGGKERHGRFIYDNVIIRYYIDGGTTPQLEFFQGAAAGSFVHLESKDYYLTSYDPKTGQPGAPCEGFTPYCGMDLADSDANDGTFQPWMTKWAGKNGAEGNWVNNFRIPFYKSVRVTAQINPDRPREIFPNTTMGLFAVLRGLEGDEASLAATTQLGGVPLPPLKSYNVQLRLLKNTAYQSDHLEFVPLVNISRWTAPSATAAAAAPAGQSSSSSSGAETHHLSGSSTDRLDEIIGGGGGSGNSTGGPHAVLNITGGALFLTTVGFRPGKGARGMDWDGGCWWALTNSKAALEPGKAMLLGTGIEDFFNSGFAFSFFGKTFHNDLSGLTHVHGSTGHGMDNPRPDWWSAYRYFDKDPLTFADGRFEFVWRNGESPGPGLTCRPTGRSTDRGAPTVIDSYSWVYTWSAPQDEEAAAAAQHVE
jgi:hypothetical protein